MSLLTSSVC